MIHISLLRTPRSSRHIPGILLEAGNLFPEKAKLPAQDSSSEPSQLKPVGHTCASIASCSSLDPGDSGSGGGPQWPGAGHQAWRQVVGGWDSDSEETRGLSLGCSESPTQPPHHQGSRGPYRVSNGLAYAGEGGGTSPLNAEPSPSTFFSCLPLRDSQSEFLRPFTSNAEKFLGAFHTLS